MTTGQTFAERRTLWLNRAHARLAARAAPATAFVTTPEPRTIGHFARGRQLLAGNFLFSGQFVEAPGTSIWDIAEQAPEIAEVIHSCLWLDDLAAVADAKASARAQDWIYDWITRYGRGDGVGWTPGLTGRRLIRWVNHAIILLRGRGTEDTSRFFASLSQQTRYLSRRWKASGSGLSRLEALTGVIYASYALEGMQALAPAALRGLTELCGTILADDGGIDSRNPEELLDVLALLNWTVLAMDEAGQPPPREVAHARAQIVPVLRALRHADGTLARFHGGGRGLDGLLDHSLAQTGSRVRLEDGKPAMGYMRLSAGRTTIIVDAAAPPTGVASVNGHASTLAIELTSGRRPMFVNCGSGASFGPEWRRAGRATPSHSTLCIEGYSSSRLGAPRRVGRRTAEILEEVPKEIPCEWSRTDDGQKLDIAHNGWRKTHGLTYARMIEMASDGRAVVGEELLTTLNDDDKRRFDRVMDASSLQGVLYAVRFHLHPDVDAELDLGGSAVSIALKSGEVWIMRQIGAQDLRLEGSVYLESGRLRPRATKQVVLTGRAMSYSTRIRWSVAKAQDTPIALRDLADDGRSIGFTPDGRAMQDDDIF